MNNPPTPPKKNRWIPLPSNVNWSEWLRSDRAILSICISIAFVFWLFTKLSYSYTSTIQVPLRYELPANKTAAHGLPDHLEVEVQGSGWDLLAASAPTLILRAQSDKIDFNNPALESLLGRELPGLRVVRVRPDRIETAVEEIATKQVPIRLESQIEPAPQHHFADSPRVSPSFVQVSGPASELQQLTEWPTASVVVQDLRAPLRRMVELKPHPNPQVRFSPNEVQCVAVVEEVTEKQLEVPLEALHLPDSLLLVLIPKKITVSAVVGLRDYAQLHPEQFRAVVDFDSKTHDNQLRVRIEKAPSSVLYMQFQPKKVDFILRTR